MATTYLEGKNAVIEALRAGMPLNAILLASGLTDDRGVGEITRRAAEVDCPVRTVARKELDRLSERGAHQGVMAEAAPFKYASLDQVIKRTEGQERALIIALDHITDPGNLGAVVRSAEVVGAAGVLVPSRRSAAVTPAAYKSSAGALAHLPLAQEANLANSLKRCKDAGFWVAGASEHAHDTIWDAPLEGRIVLVMGSEGEGLSRLTLETCDFLVKLPQYGQVGSLNVAQATTAIAYEWLRRGSLA